MIEEALQIRARRGELCFGPDDIKLYALQKLNRGRFAAQRLELVKIPENTEFKPFITIPSCEAQKLMDDLWDCGLRPSEGTGSAGAMAATQKHLHDMKIIAFHALKMNTD